jgi:hypothetical protein
MTISVRGIKPEPYLFHNTKVNVYRKSVKFKQIQYWPDNLRTLLAFDVLQTATGKNLSRLSLKQVTEFLVNQRPDLELGDLARSIRQNGVRVPIILLDNGTLLDGNRRFFACSHIYNGLDESGEMPEVLRDIPAMVIKENDIDSRTRQKILAEANFVPDYKVPWTLDVKAKVISDYYQDCLRQKMTEEQTYAEIRDVYGLTQREVVEYVESVDLSNEYIKGGGDADRNKRREHVQSRFVYFWEFRNKASRGRSALDQEKELPEAKELFFKMIGLERFKNMKQVEPMIRARRSPELWRMLKGSGGSKIDQVAALLEEERSIRRAEDKIRNFLRWLQGKAEPQDFTKASFTLLEKLAAAIKEILGRHS